MDIKVIQSALKKHAIDGWLLYDFRRTNDLACRFLSIPEEVHLTRRFFYWIPADGEPIKIVHSIEPRVLDHLPGKAKTYLRWQQLEEILRTLLQGAKKVAMEYSPFNRLPAVSRVDGGTIELIRSFGAQIESSAFLLQLFAVWGPEKLQNHLAAAHFLDQVVERAWIWIKGCLEKGTAISEWDVSQWILREFNEHGFETDSPPICAVNAHSADPHYSPAKESSEIKRGDFILIDLWCKKKGKSAPYADITRVGVASSQPAAKQNEIFQIVRRAQKTATEFIQKRFEKKEVVKGFEVDEVCRDVIVKAGYGDFFVHRTGHNIDEEAHGPGTHIDSFETVDDRQILGGTCFSIEPGIYLPQQFGVRLEYDVYVHLDGSLQITGGQQEGIRCLWRE